MKKFITIMLVLVMLFSLTACGTKTYKLGDVIETDLFRITPKFSGFAYKLANDPYEFYMTPSNEKAKTNKSPYVAGEGKVEMYGEVDIEYIGNEKENVYLKMDISANYNNGYNFEIDGMGFSVDGKGDWDDGCKGFEPLSDSKTRVMRYCFEVPKEVETNKDKSLLVTFKIDNKEYVYDFRSAEVLGSDYDPRADLYKELDETTKKQVVDVLKQNGVKVWSYYETTFGEISFEFGDSSVTATLPINRSYQYDFEGTYEVFSGTILVSWDHGDKYFLDYTLNGNTIEISDTGYLE